MSVTRQAWVWLLLGLSACARVAPSAAPLSTRAESEPSPAAAAAAPSATPSAPAPPAKAAAKQGKRALYARACKLGSAVGCNDLAILLGEDLAQAMPLFERSCELGLARGCANLGVQLLRHQPSEKERDRAMSLLSSACDVDDAYACAELGDARYDTFQHVGAGAYGRAHAAYEKACKLGHMDACSSDGWLFRNGEGTKQDPTRARELFRFACEHDSYSGCAALGYDLIDSAKNSDEFAEGLRWLKLSCEHDSAFGCFSLGATLSNSSEGKDVASGVALLKRACQLGLPNGCQFAEAVEQRLKSPPDASAQHDGAEPPAED